MDLNVNIKVEISSEIIELTTKLLSLFTNAHSVTLENKPKTEEVKVAKVAKEEVKVAKVAKEEVKVESKPMPEAIDTQINAVKFTREDLLKVIQQLKEVGYQASEIKATLNSLGFEKTSNVTTEEDYFKVMNAFGTMLDKKQK